MILKFKFNTISLNQYHTFIYLLFFCCFIAIFTVRNLIKRCLTYLLCKRIIKAQAGTDENYTANYFISLEKSHLEVIISKAKNELLDFVNLYETLKNNEHQESFIESLAWYIENLKSIIIKCEDALKEINSHEYVNPESSRPTVNDHTYDISEIFPYNIFFASEKLDKEEIIEIKMETSNHLVEQDQAEKESIKELNESDVY